MTHLIYAVTQRRRASYDKRSSWRYHLKDQHNPFDLRENDFIRRFRLSRDATLWLIEELRPHINIGNSGYSLELQVLYYCYYKTF